VVFQFHPRKKRAKPSKFIGKRKKYLQKPEGCLTVHLPYIIMCKVNLMEQGNFIEVFTALRVSGAYAHHQEH